MRYNGDDQEPRLGKSVTQDRKSPVPARAGNAKLWAFSFRFWRQIDFFGLDRTDASWLVSVFERLSELSKYKIEEFRISTEMHSAWRYHKIDWNQKNIPVQRSDLNWISRDYLDNSDEYPLLQFQISKSLGRVIGFWDERDVFNVVLLDPFHNMQPAKSHEYRVDPCAPLSCDYTSLVLEVESITSNVCEKQNCDHRMHFKSAVTRKKMLESHNVLIVKLTDEQKEYADQIMTERKDTSMSDVFSAGLEKIYQE